MTAVVGSDSSEEAGEVALVVGLLLSLASMTTAMAQVERGANRIYGIRRDRPARAKYGRATVLTAVLALPVGAGLLLLVAGCPLADRHRAAGPLDRRAARHAPPAAGSRPSRGSPSVRGSPSC